MASCFLYCNTFRLSNEDRCSDALKRRFLTCDFSQVSNPFSHGRKTSNFPYKRLFTSPLAFSKKKNAGARFPFLSQVSNPFSHGRKTSNFPYKRLFTSPLAFSKKKTPVLGSRFCFYFHGLGERAEHTSRHTKSGRRRGRARREVPQPSQGVSDCGEVEDGFDSR